VTSFVFETLGSDYAEYLLKSNINEVFEKGQVIGINNMGRITSHFDEAIRFAVVSDNAGVIGGTCENKDICEVVAFCGRVHTQKPINEFTSGDYLVPVKASDGSINVKAVQYDNLSFVEYIQSVGQIINVDNEIPLVIVK
jgi:hypothetical protein